MDMCMGASEGEGRRRPYSPGPIPPRCTNDLGHKEIFRTMMTARKCRSAQARTVRAALNMLLRVPAMSAKASLQPTSQNKALFGLPPPSSATCCRLAHLSTRPSTVSPCAWSSSAANHANSLGKTAQEEKIRATADGELVLYQHGNGRYNFTEHRPALLEAKKRVAVVKDGESACTNEFLGQVTCEALAFRLQRCQTPGAGLVGER